MSRLGPIAQEDLTPEQRALFDAITGGARGKNSSPEEFLNDEGALRGPFNALLRAPELGDLVQKVGEKVRFGTSLPGAMRELAIITCARFWRSNYEWYAHKRLAIKEGVSEEDCTAVMGNTYPRDPDLATVWRFVQELNTKKRVSDENYAAALDLLGEQGVTELTILTGYYALISHILNVYQVPLPAGETAPFPD